MAAMDKPVTKVAILTAGGLAPCLSAATGYVIEKVTRECLPPTDGFEYLDKG